MNQNSNSESPKQRNNAEKLTEQNSLLSIPSVKAIPVILAVFVVLTACLTVFVNEAGSGTLLKQTTLIYGSGGTFTTNVYQSLITNFFAFKAKNGVSGLSYSYNSSSSGLGRADFFSGLNLFAVTDTDISVSQNKFILPESVNGPNSLAKINASQYINPATPSHLGVIMLPGIGAGLGIIYNIPTLQASSNPPLVFNASVLGAIFSGNITLWNDTAIQELNPSVKLPGQEISVIVRGDSSGSTQILTTYLEKYSKPFQTKVGKGSQPKWPATFIKRDAALLLL